MESKHRFNIVKCEGDLEIRIWSGRCTENEMRRRFDAAIREQIIKYDIDRKPCQLRVYDEHGILIAQETFHER